MADRCIRVCGVDVWAFTEPPAASVPSMTAMSATRWITKALSFQGCWRLVGITSCRSQRHRVLLGWETGEYRTASGEPRRRNSSIVC